MSKELNTKEDIVAYYTEVIEAKEAEIKRLKDDNLILTKTLLKSEDKMQQITEEFNNLRKKQ